MNSSSISWSYVGLGEPNIFKFSKIMSLALRGGGGFMSHLDNGVI